MRIKLNELQKHIDRGFTLIEAFQREEAEILRRADQVKAAGPIHGAITPLGFRR